MAESGIPLPRHANMGGERQRQRQAHRNKKIIQEIILGGEGSLSFSTFAEVSKEKYGRGGREGRGERKYVHMAHFRRLATSAMMPSLL